MEWCGISIFEGAVKGRREFRRSGEGGVEFRRRGEGQMGLAPDAKNG